ncbi:hypothetical protein CBL_10975 [Carabus blaptoides fortunei]
MRDILLTSATGQMVGAWSVIFREGLRCAVGCRCQRTVLTSGRVDYGRGESLLEKNLIAVISPFRRLSISKRRVG